MSPFQLAEANQRWRWLKAAKPLLASGLSQAAVAGAIGVSAPTFSRLLNRFPTSHLERKSVFNAHEKCRRLLAAGREGLAPSVAEGRKSPFASLLRNVDVSSELRRLFVETISECAEPAAGRRTGNISLALKRLGEYPLMPPRLAAKLQAGGKPKPLIKFLNREFSFEKAARLWRYQHRATAGKLLIQIQSNNRPEIRLGNRRLSP